MRHANMHSSSLGQKAAFRAAAGVGVSKVSEVSGFRLLR